MPDEGVNFQASLDLARGLGAGSAIVGSIVSTGTEVWLSGTLVNVSGRRVAEETVSGAREQLLRLVDSLAIQLVRATWSVQEPVPRLRVSALTTGSLPAARAYLRGERHYRSLEWDSAIVALEEAIGRDSTFALAYHRLSEALNWRDGFSQAGAAAESQAVTHIDRLPARDQTIIRAKMLDRRGDLASIDTMRAYVARYPTDPEGWYYLGDVQFHGWRLLGLSLPELLVPFDRALSIEPRLATVLVHPLEMSLIFGDSVRFSAYLEQLEAIGGATQRYLEWKGLMWGDPAAGVRLLASSLEQASPQAWVPPLHGILYSSNIVPDLILAAFDTVSAKLSGDELALTRIESLRVSVLQALGRLAEADQVIDRMAGKDPVLAATMSLRPVLAGVREARDSDGNALRIITDRSHPLVGAYWSASYDLAVGRAFAQFTVDEPSDGVAEESGEVYAGLTLALGAWAMMQQGDTASAVSQLRSGLVQAGTQPGLLQVGYPINTGALRFRLALALTTSPETREEGIRRLQASVPDYEYMAPSFLLMGRTLELEGRFDDARQAYGHVLRLWNRADPELASHRREAEASLGRLAREDGGGSY